MDTSQRATNWWIHQSPPLFLGSTANLACLVAAGWASLSGDLNLMVSIVLFASSGIENMNANKVVRYVVIQTLCVFIPLPPWDLSQTALIDKQLI